MQDIDPIDKDPMQPQGSVMPDVRVARSAPRGRDRSGGSGEEGPPYTALGHTSIDRDHRHLLSLVARFADLAIDHAPSDALAEAICDLTEFTRSHFQYEEVLMTGSGFPGCDAHRIDHAALMRQLSLYLYRFSTADEISPVDIVDSLQNWFAGHVQRFDGPMVQFLLDRRQDDLSSAGSDGTAAG